MIYLGNSPVGIVGKVPLPYDIPKKDDGNAYVYVYLTNPNDLDARIYISSSNPAGTYTVDWGDGNTETAGGSAYIDHTYQKTGFYTVKLTVITGTPRLGGSGNTWLMGGGSSERPIYQYKLMGLETGDWGIASQEFADYSNSIAIYARRCPYLAYSALNARSCKALSTLELPAIASNYASYQFNGCFGIKEVTIPKEVTNIGSYVFRDCGIISFHMESSTPPTLGSGAFNGCEVTIYVPTGSLTTYQAAENWSTYANNMVEE